jgi:phage-related protein
MLLHNLLNVLEQIANKMGLQKKYVGGIVDTAVSCVASDLENISFWGLAILAEVHQIPQYNY